MEASAPGCDVIICQRQLFFIVFFKRVDLVFLFIFWYGERPSSADLILHFIGTLPFEIYYIFNTGQNCIFLAEIVDDEMRFYFLSLKCEKSVVIVYVKVRLYVFGVPM